MEHPHQIASLTVHMRTRRLLIIANKWFEVDPLLAVIWNGQARPPQIQDITDIAWPSASEARPGDMVVRPRCALSLGRWAIEIWCIQDLMNPFISSSSTAEKARVLPLIFSYGAPPSTVIAFGTAATPSDESFNGSVAVGARIYMHDAHADSPNPASTWHNPRMDKLIPSDFPAEFFDQLKTDSYLRENIAKRLLAAPANPAKEAALLIDERGTAVSTVNITDPGEYDKIDPKSAALCEASGGKPVLSVETTHGVIRVQTEAPFLFVSGIANRMLHYGDENKGAYRQNFAAAHNAGIALAWALPAIVRVVDGM